MLFNLPNSENLNIVPHFVVTSNQKIILLLPHKYKFTTVMNHNKNIIYMTFKGGMTHRLKNIAVMSLKELTY